MAGVDLNDQLRSYYPIGRKSHKWWRSCFWYLLEVAVLNAYIIYKTTARSPGSKVLSHFQFHLELARSLCKEGGRKKAAAEAGVAAAGLANQAPNAHRRVKLPGRKKQCYQCRAKDIRTASGRRPETAFGCASCNVHLCDELCLAQFHAHL